MIFMVLPAPPRMVAASSQTPCHTTFCSVQLPRQWMPSAALALSTTLAIEAPSASVKTGCWLSLCPLQLVPTTRPPQLTRPVIMPGLQFPVTGPGAGAGAGAGVGLGRGTGCGAGCGAGAGAGLPVAAPRPPVALEGIEHSFALLPGIGSLPNVAAVHVNVPFSVRITNRSLAPYATATGPRTFQVSPCRQIVLKPFGRFDAACASVTYAVSTSVVQNRIRDHQERPTDFLPS